MSGDGPVVYGSRTSRVTFSQRGMQVTFSRHQFNHELKLQTPAEHGSHARHGGMCHILTTTLTR